MKEIVRYQFSPEYGLGFQFDTGAILVYGPGMVPGTDVPTYRFMYSKGFNSREDYLNAQKVVYKHSKEQGYESLLDFLKTEAMNSTKRSH